MLLKSDHDDRILEKRQLLANLYNLISEKRKVVFSLCSKNIFDFYLLLFLIIGSFLLSKICNLQVLHYNFWNEENTFSLT